MVFITARRTALVREGTRGGRGNLRENREDPAPTVGICGEDIKTSAPINDAARCVVTRLRRPR